MSRQQLPRIRSRVKEVMTERGFRLVLGTVLLALLYFDFELGVHVYIGVLLFEGLTNWRIPLIVSRLRYGTGYSSAEALSPGCSRISFDAERVLRLIVAVLLIATFVLLKDTTWIIPWFVASMLLVAGITNICPMVMALQWMGFR